MEVRAKGFSLIEMLIVVMLLGIVGVLAAPRFTSAGNVPRDAALRDDLRHMRTQILVYRAHHNDVAPGYPQGDRSQSPSAEVMIEQLTRFTNGQGQTSLSATSEFRFGRYLQTVPINPINGSAEVRLVGDMPFPDAPVGDEGWIYQPTTGIIAANVAGTDAAGVRYFDY